LIQSEILVLAGLAQALPDTVVAVQSVPAWRAWVDVLAAVATIVVALALLALGLVLLVLARKARALVARADEAARRLRIDVEPAIHNAIAVTENLNFLSRTVRRDAEQLSRTVNRANDRLNATLQAAEQKVGELNAVLGVVQQEAESLFIGAAASVRGVAAGADTFRRLQAEGDAEALLDEEIGDAYGEDDDDLEDFYDEDDLEDFGDDDDDDLDGDGVEVEYLFEDEDEDEDEGEDAAEDDDEDHPAGTRRSHGIDPDRVF
jgi:uncharacterized protein YoxC